VSSREGDNCAGYTPLGETEPPSEGQNLLRGPEWGLVGHVPDCLVRSRMLYLRAQKGHALDTAASHGLRQGGVPISARGRTPPGGAWIQWSSRVREALTLQGGL